MIKKKLFIAEKPSVARQFADVFSEKMTDRKGYLESKSLIVTWCVGHLVTMSYPEAYDPRLKKWRLEDLPFIPDKFKYEIISSAKNQFDVVSGLMNREDVDRIYICTDSGREGEYIYRLVRQEANVHDKEEYRVWIDSQTREEIQRGIRDAKPDSEYDNIGKAAYLRAEEDYLMGINFSRLLTIKFGRPMADFLNKKYCVVSVGRVMTCVLGMVVRREREIREFKKTPFYRILGTVLAGNDSVRLEGEWRVTPDSIWSGSPKLYKENGFLNEDDAKAFIEKLKEENKPGEVVSVSKKTEKKAPPLLYNLAEIQNDCSRFFKVSPDETLNIIQSLYEKKLVTYPRTDARVLSTAVANEIDRNIKGVSAISGFSAICKYILDKGLYKGIAKTRYTDDKKITDHYALIPTGQGLSAIKSLKTLEQNIYELIVRRFLVVFLPPAEYTKLNAEIKSGSESFFFTGKFLKSPGYLSAMDYSFFKKKESIKKDEEEGKKENDSDEISSADPEKVIKAVSSLRKGSKVDFTDFKIKAGETSPPKRYNSGSIILAMENAGQLIDDDELRNEIKGRGIGTSATRAEILKKLVKNAYLNLNKKTQIITPTLTGEIIYDIVDSSMSPMLNPELTASWEKGLGMVENGEISPEEYFSKLKSFVVGITNRVRPVKPGSGLNELFKRDASFYKK